ncbi:MoxR-like ATPase [Flavobacterium sp. HSC-32F16]|uniref:AAA family ATPase n=1 Tax=Flavobacterium sp. HSC-32F16 TaxID=2910964 RepID=UPI0020A5F5CA|nr:AAA family ATPase [Flavobacterium sp. HSC-32F16]MCP2027423.1 MoxR-like ATPase [Flavobacterium sp. HSC-32F16]
MDLELKNKINTVLQHPKSLEIIRTTDFYFQKAKDAFQDFLQLEVNEETKTFLLTNRKEYNELKQLFVDSQDLAVFGKLLFTVITYCDSNAHKKRELNAYEDKRVLALAFVRMNNWVEQLITYKFEGQLAEGSVKNAVEYMLNPIDNFTMLSENHRSQISQNLFKKIYNKTTFKEDFSTFFSQFSVSVKNSENYTHLLTRLAYHIETSWKDSLIGLICPDTTGWQEDAINDSKSGNHIVLWNHKKPNGTSNTLKLLRQSIEEKGYFQIFYTSTFKVNYIAEVIDFVENQNELNKVKWTKNYGDIEWYNDDWSYYKDGNKTANWIYLARKIEKVKSNDYTDFQYYKTFDYPSVGCQAPVVSYRNSLEINRENKMNQNINLLEYKKQIILQGPPGTGKTREAKLIVKEMLSLDDIEDLKDNEQFKLIQFHPSYTYEDFVRGIVAESKGDRMEYKNVNRTLGLFAEKAFKNFKDSKKVPELISKEIWAEEHYLKFKEHLESELEKSEQLLIKKDTKPKITALEDNAVRVNRYSNEDDSVLIKDIDIINGYIGLHLSDPIVKVKDNIILSKSARSGMYYLYQNLIEKFNQYLKDANLIYKTDGNLEAIKLKKYVLVIDEINRANLSSLLGELIYALEYRGETVESMYAVEDDNKLILPSNLYIIGTMNTADRSVGHIDYAIRRRFAFVDVLPQDLSDDNAIIFDRNLFLAVKELFTTDDYKTHSAYLSKEFEPKDVALGHSYFIDKSAEGGSVEIRLEYEIKPILFEYVKDGVLIGDDIKTKIEDLKASI